MLIPRARAWSQQQRWLIVTLVTAVLALFSAAVYAYERYYRGPGEDALYGTWEAPDFFDSGDIAYFQFRPDQTFSLGSLDGGEFSPFINGRWYAGGPNIYLRFSAEDIGPRRPIILHIVDVRADEFHVSLIRHGQIYTFRHLTPQRPNASNQATQRTASKPATDVLPVCHPDFGCVAHFTGLAVADLVTR